MPSFFSSTRRLTQVSVRTSSAVPITSLTLRTIIRVYLQISECGRTAVFVGQRLGHAGLDHFQAAHQQAFLDGERGQQLEHFVARPRSR